MRKVSIVSVLLLVLGCTNTAYLPETIHSPCDKGTPNGVACIDPATLNPTTNPVHSGNGQIFNAFLGSSRNDEIEITSEAYAWHKRKGSHAWAQLRNDLEVGKTYKYTIRDLTTQKVNDPDILIDY